MNTQIVWFEVAGANPAALQSFYGEVLGWRFQPAPGDETYGIVDVPEGSTPGGVGVVPGSSWTTFYVAVEDLEAAIQRALSAGGTLLMPRKDLPFASFAVVADPEGHAMGLSQATA